MRAYERLLRYASVNTTSREGRENTPSGAGGFPLGELLAEEMDACVEILLHLVEEFAKTKK